MIIPAHCPYPDNSAYKFRLIKDEENTGAIRSSMAMSTFSWHHSLCELMTLEKSSIGPRLEAATPLTWWKHAFSPCCNGRDFTRACVHRLTSERKAELFQ